MGSSPVFETKGGVVLGNVPYGRGFWFLFAFRFLAVLWCLSSQRQREWLGYWLRKREILGGPNIGSLLSVATWNPGSRIGTTPVGQLCGQETPSWFHFLGNGLALSLYSISSTQLKSGLTSIWKDREGGAETQPPPPSESSRNFDGYAILPVLQKSYISFPQYKFTRKAYEAWSRPNNAWEKLWATKTLVFEKAVKEF